MTEVGIYIICNFYLLIENSKQSRYFNTRWKYTYIRICRKLGFLILFATRASNIAFLSQFCGTNMSLSVTLFTTCKTLFYMHVFHFAKNVVERLILSIKSIAKNSFLDALVAKFSSQHFDQFRSCKIYYFNIYYQIFAV